VLAINAGAVAVRIVSAAIDREGSARGNGHAGRGTCYVGGTIAMPFAPPPPEDPRVRFAAERTLLAWIRTGLAMMSTGG
jgi:hypothetical protein